MKKFTLGIVLVLVLFFCGAFLYVSSIDWNKHKDKISEQFYNSTGKYIVFDGNVNFKIFPTPYLSAVNVKIYNTENKREKPLLDIKNVNAELSLLSLIKGDFNIDRMVLDKPDININWDDKGLNWQGDLSLDQRRVMENTKMVLNSVSLKNAKVNFEASNGEINLSLDNLNGEIIAQSIFGPFRIEGNYTKDDVVQGFAITLGKLDESLPTTLNAVLTHPKSDSYLRFDGSFQLTNKVLNGNTIIESQRFSDFVNDNFENMEIDEVYNKPFVLGFDVAINKQMIDFSNIVLKYEETQGAGTLKIPNKKLDSPNIKIKFDFADLALDPVVDFIKNFIKKYSDKKYDFNKNIKVVADIKSVRASYDEQNFKNLDISFELNEKGFLLDNMNMILPGNALLGLKGNIYSYEGDIYYQADLSLNSEDLMRLLKWLKIEPKASVASVYKKMLLTTKVSGNFDKIQISPYKIVLDNTTFNGDAGIILGDRKDIILNVNADVVNFDNYINSIPDEIKAQSFVNRMNYRFSKLGHLNDFDMVLNADANLVIYEGVPFENVKFKGNILQGILDVERLFVEKVANTKLDLAGKFSGFGNKMYFENLQCNVETSNLENMIDKFGLYKPNVDYSQLQNLKLNSVISGEADNFVGNTEIVSGDMILNYSGNIKFEDQIFFAGDAELKYPDIVKFIELLGVDYIPRGSGLGLLKLKSTVEGSPYNMKFSNMEVSSGYSQFNGDLFYDFRNSKRILNSNLKINKLEVEKYLSKGSSKLLVSNFSDGEIPSFLVKPVWNKNKIDYSLYDGLDVDANFEISDLSYKNYLFNNAKFKLNIKDGIMNISDYEAIYNNTPIKVQLGLNMQGEPVVNIIAEIVNANVSDFSLGGRVYNLKDGKFSVKMNLESKALSEENFVENLKGNINFNIIKTKVFGVNIGNIYNDIINRTQSEGLADFVNLQIANGSTNFDKIEGKFVINNGELKITDTLFSANNTSITAKGTCDIRNWIMDVLFDISHNEPKFLQNYMLHMKNSMDNPDVSFEISKLFNVFKVREDQEDAEKKAKEEFQKQRLIEQVNEQKKIAEDLVKSIKEKVNIELEEKIKNSFSDEAKKMYENVKVELDTLMASFLGETLAVESEKVTLEQFEQLKSFNVNVLQNVEILKNKIEEINLIDMQKQNLLEYNKIIEVNNELKNVIEDYNVAVADYSTRLSNIITQYSLESDENYISSKKEIDEIINNLEKMNNDVVTSHNLYSVDASIIEYEKLNNEMKEVLNNIMLGKDELLTKINEFKDITNKIIQREEELYREKLEKEENQRLIEENTGSILIKKTGKKMKVTRDIEDIKEAREDINNEVVKVIDFTKEKSSDEENKKQNLKGVIKKGRINR